MITEPFPHTLLLELELEHKHVFNNWAADYSLQPSYLAMVTAKIQGTISGSPCKMLIDKGSELNIMVQSIQMKLELPIDLSGRDQLLQGVSGHQVNLVGICHDVLVFIGGI